MGTLRFLLALAVVIVHTSYVYGYSDYGLRLTGAVVSVQAFYMLSGFYMALILNTKYTGKGSYRLFITNRFLRIYPAYWVVLLLTCALSAVPTFDHMFGFTLWDYLGADNPLNLGSIVFLNVTNFLLFGQDVVLFLGIRPDEGLYFTTDFRESKPPLFEFLPVPQAWTLSLELMFYILAPFLARRRTYILLCLIAGSLALRLYIYFVADLYHDPWTYRFFPAELAFFIAGMVSYRLYLWLKERTFSGNLAPAATIAVLCTTIGFQFLPGYVERQWAYYGLLFWLMPFLFIFSNSHHSTDGWLGELSYPMYVCHVFVLLALSPLLKGISSGLASFVACAATVLFSLALMHFVSAPIDNYRQGRIRGLGRHGAEVRASPHV
jgi:peptidoglycan/LPS O-acetylase OafA/YrhL